MVERALLIIVAVAMVIAPIGWSIPGLAPLVAGVLMILHHLRVTRGPVRESGAPGMNRYPRCFHMASEEVGQ